MVLLLTGVLLRSEGAAAENWASEYLPYSQAPTTENNSEHVEYVSSHHVGGPLRLGCARIIVRRLAGPESNKGSVGLRGHDRERNLMVEESVGL